MKNFGADPHEIVITQADSIDDLPRADGAVDIDALPEKAFRVMEFAGNTICEGTFDLPAGQLRRLLEPRGTARQRLRAGHGRDVRRQLSRPASCRRRVVGQACAAASANVTVTGVALVMQRWTGAAHDDGRGQFGRRPRSGCRRRRSAPPTTVDVPPGPQRHLLGSHHHSPRPRRSRASGDRAERRVRRRAFERRRHESRRRPRSAATHGETGVV